jgi:hypothetical protein
VADQKLKYTVDVDTGSAVRDLDKLGDAGEKAGKQIAEGFDDAASKSKRAIDALSAQLDKVEADAKGAAEAVSAIKANLTIDVDDSKIAAFASDIRNKMGVAFDDITADAKQFADVLERGVNMDRTKGELRGVGDELEHVRGESDQSRSVLANLAGNAAQDLGELGGVVGTLGVGVGQLAEYAVDGNIALRSLAGVAGPMAALSVATLAVQNAMQNMAATKAFNADQVKGFSDAVNELGDSSLALRSALDGAFNARVDDNSFFGQLLQKEKTVDLADNLAAVGVSLANIDDIIRSGASDRASFEMLPDVQNLDKVLQAAGLSANDYNAVMDGVFEATKNWTTATIGGAEAAKFFGTSLEDVNNILEQQLISEDPFTRFNQGLFQTGGHLVDLQAIWNDVVNDMRDSDANFASTAGNVDVLAEAMNLSTDEVIQLARETAAATTFTKSFDSATRDATDAVKHAGQIADGTAVSVAAIGHVLDSTDWGTASIDAASTAMQGFFDTFTVSRDAVAGVNEALDSLQEAFKAQQDAGGQELLPNLSTPEGRATLAALEQLGTSLIPDIQKAFDDSNGSADKFNEKMTGIYQRTLNQLTSQLHISEDAAKQLLAQIGLTPDNFSTQYELIGDELALQQLQLLQGVIEGLPRDVQSKITYQISTGDYQGAVQTIVNYGASHPVVQSSKVNTSGAQSDIDYFRNRQESDPLNITVKPLWSTLWSAGPPVASTIFTRAAPAPSGLAVTPAAAVEAAPFDDDTPGPSTPVAPSNIWMPTSAAAAVPVRPMTVNVNVSAGVIGNRFDVQRAVLRAVRQGTRIRGQAALVAS